MELNTQTILVVFVAITGLAVLLQACVLIGILISLQKTAKAVLEATEDVRTTIIPMAESSRRLLERLSPQVISITDNMVEVTQSMREQTAEVRETTAVLLDKLQRQSIRLDGMLSTGLDAVERAGNVVESTIAAPVRQVNGIMNAIRAAMDVFRYGPPRQGGERKDPTHAGGDRDMFI